MKLKSFIFRRRDAEFWACFGIIAVVVLIFGSAFALDSLGILNFKNPPVLSDSERIAVLEQRLDSVEGQLKAETTLKHLSGFTGDVKRAECSKAVSAYGADNKKVPESISHECAIAWAEGNKDATPQTAQEQADEFMAKLLPTLADVAPKAKKSACEMFIQMYQQENLRTPPEMIATCNLNSMQKRADDFISQEMPKLENSNPRKKHAMCKNFTHFYQSEQLTIPPAMTAACNL